MKKGSMYIGGIVALLFLLSTAHTEPYPEVVNHCEEAGRMWFDSLNVRFVGNWPFGTPYAVTLDTARNFVFCGSGGGVFILDITDPGSPVRVSEKIRTRGRLVRGLFYESSTQRLYIADGYMWKNDIWDVSNPSNPYEVGYYETSDNAAGVAVSGTYVYVADAFNGLQIYEFLPPGVEESKQEVLSSKLKLLQNPIKGEYVELWLYLAHEEMPVLSLYNALGQRVKVFFLNKTSSGEHLVRIPIKDLPSGVYFLKLEAGDYSATEKLLLIR